MSNNISDNSKINIANSSENGNDSTSTNRDSDSTSKLISTITEYIPTFFSPNGILTHEKEDDFGLNIVEIIGQCELFFSDHPNSFTSEENKCSYVIHKLHGPSKKWSLSLKADGTLQTLGYNMFKELLIKNFGDSNEQ
eukprot:jgi/Orpsp1_1/1179645/evm.model.c7180000070190.1